MSLGASVGKVTPVPTCDLCGFATPICGVGASEVGTERYQGKGGHNLPELTAGDLQCVYSMRTAPSAEAKPFKCRQVRTKFHFQGVLQKGV